MARPYVVNFPRSAGSFSDSATAGYNRETVIANLQTFPAGTYVNEPLILNELRPGTVPNVQFRADNPIPATLNDTQVHQPLPAGAGTQIPGGARSLLIVAPTGGTSLASLMFTATGLDQFGNPLIYGGISGPTAGAGKEVPTPTGAILPLPTASGGNAFVLYFSNLSSITFSGTVGSAFSMWVGLGGYGVTPFISVDTYRTGWKGSVEISGFTAPSSSWSYTVYGTNYPIYTPSPGGKWATVDPTTGKVGKHLICGVSSVATSANATYTQPTTNVNMSAAVNNAWAEITSPTAYIWAEVGWINNTFTPTGALTHSSEFTLTYVQQGA